MSDRHRDDGRQELRLSSRQRRRPDDHVMLPVMIMLLFVYLFGGAIHTGTHYVTYVVPGIVLLCAGFGSSMTAVTVSQDMNSGIIDRFRSMDVGGTAMLAGHVVASVVRNTASTVIVFGGRVPDRVPAERRHRSTGSPRPASSSPTCSPSPGCRPRSVCSSRSPEAANGFGFFVMFLPYASSGFVPVSTMPGWIHGFAANQPVTPVTETIRGLLLNKPLGDDPWIALAWCAGITVVSVAAAAALFRRRTA